MGESCAKSCLRRGFSEATGDSRRVCITKREKAESEAGTERARERETEHICANAAPTPKFERISVTYQVFARRACGA